MFTEPPGRRASERDPSPGPGAAVLEEPTRIAGAFAHGYFVVLELFVWSFPGNFTELTKRESESKVKQVPRGG
jgi:hypothetical protein